MYTFSVAPVPKSAEFQFSFGSFDPLVSDAFKDWCEHYEVDARDVRCWGDSSVVVGTCSSIDATIMKMRWSPCS